MTNKRITLQVGDFIKLSDIPNEQVFNLVKQCFTNAGFPSESEWNERLGWSAFYATSGYPSLYSCFVQSHSRWCNRQISLSDVFNSINGGFDWMRYTIPMLRVGAEYDTRVLACYDGVVIKRIHDAPEAIISEKTYQWWDYEKECAVGLPDVDTECEYSLSNGRTWYKCKIISHNKLVLDCPHIEDENGNGLQIVNKNAVMFRPLDYKTKKQVIVDKTFEAIFKYITAGGDLKLVRETIELLHDIGLLKGDK